MFGLGVLINTGAVILGGFLGVLIKKGVPERFQKTLMSCCGLATIFLAVAGVMQCMLKITDGGLSSQGSLLLILSIVIGGFLGELLSLEKRMDGLGEKIKKLCHAQNDNKFVEGFVNASLIMCVGAMAIVGSIQDGLTGDYSMILAKSILDTVVAIILASTYGVGVICSAIVIFVYQGLITLVAHFAGSFISDALIFNLSFIGSALIFCVGVNLAFGKKFKTANLLPALLVPIVYEIILIIF